MNQNEKRALEDIMQATGMGEEEAKEVMMAGGSIMSFIMGIPPNVGHAFLGTVATEFFKLNYSDELSRNLAIDKFTATLKDKTSLRDIKTVGTC